jgi:hypothetical protein
MDRPVLRMQTKTLIAKLIEIGRASRGENSAICPLVIEAQDCALQMQREMLSLLRENEDLRRLTHHQSISSLKQGKLA